MPQVVKQDGSRAEFDLAKLRTSFMRALHKRPVPTEYVEAAMTRIEERILGLGDDRYLGEWHAFRQYLGGVTGPASTRQYVWFEPDVLPGYAWSFPLPPGRDGKAVLRDPLANVVLYGIDTEGKATVLFRVNSEGLPVRVAEAAQQGPRPAKPEADAETAALRDRGEGRLVGQRRHGRGCGAAWRPSGLSPV